MDRRRDSKAYLAEHIARKWLLRQSPDRALQNTKGGIPVSPSSSSRAVLEHDHPATVADDHGRLS